MFGLFDGVMTWLHYLFACLLAAWLVNWLFACWFLDVWKGRNVLVACLVGW